jgi:hypothetical protein
MTPQEQAIVDAIWGEDAHEIDKATLDGLFAMADLAAARAAEGKIVYVPVTDTLH